MPHPDRCQLVLDNYSTIDAQVPDDLDIHCILDTTAPHKTLQVRPWLAAHPCFHLHFTPTSASWPNTVKRWFEMLTEKQIKGGRHSRVRDPHERIAAPVCVDHDRRPDPGQRGAILSASL